MLDTINEAIENSGGAWLKLNRIEHGPVEGDIVDVEVRDKTFEGAAVLSRKSGQPRKEWVVTLRLDPDKRENPEDDGLRKLSLNESGQRAFAAAVKEAKSKVDVGGRLKIAVKVDPPSDREQAEYQARYTPPVAGAADIDAAVNQAGTPDPF